MNCEDPETFLVTIFLLPELDMDETMPHVGGLLAGIRIAFKVGGVPLGGWQEGCRSAQALMYSPEAGRPIRRDVLAFAQASASPLKDPGAVMTSTLPISKEAV